MNVHSKTIYSNILIIGVATLLFLLSIHLIGQSFSLIGKDYVRYILNVTSNPSIGLFIGLLSTAILQSSSTTTSMVVAAVAAGSLSLGNAIPIIMGANIGTTLTSTIISLNYVTKGSEFRKAVAAGTSHDIFNILVVLLLFPLEIRYGFLSTISQTLASAINLQASEALLHDLYIYQFFNLIGSLINPVISPYGMLAFSIFLLFFTIKFISNILYKKLISRTRFNFENYIFKNSSRSFGWGFLFTATIQSSSLTTSLIVPLVATGKVRLKRAFEFILGANLGTTITALLAAVFKSEAAVSLAIAHFIFNFLGIFIFLLIPVLRSLPIYLSDQLGAVSERYRLTAFTYILVVFFILPFTLIYYSKKTDLSTFNHTEKIAPPLANKLE